MDAMYAPQNNGPHTLLASAANSAQTSITVENASVLPDAPNVLTVGTDEDAELVLLESKAGNILTVQRGYNGTAAKAWDAGTWIYRAITAQDIAALQRNVIKKAKIEKVWVNADHRSQFDGQTVSPANMDAESNDIVMIRYATNTNATSIGMAGFGKAGQVAQLQAVVPGTGSYPEIRHRSATIHSTSIEFSDATSKRTNANTEPTTNNGLIIPLEIYVISEVVIP